MRLMQEEMIGYDSEEERDMESSSSCGSIGELGFHEKSMKVVVVGYALTSKKIKSFLQPKFEGLARNKGIFFVAIDHTRPLSDQGPFDIVLHKVSAGQFFHIGLSTYVNHHVVWERMAANS